MLAWTALLGIGLDQATKAFMAATREGKPPIRVVGQILTVYVTRNSGAAFGFAPAATLLFTGVAVAAVVVIVMKVSRLHSAGWAAALGLVLAGAIGNLCDRLLRAPGIGRGAVVDFIDLRHFADFNIADSCLTCGVVLIVLLSLRGIPMTDNEGTSVPVRAQSDTERGAGPNRALLIDSAAAWASCTCRTGNFVIRWTHWTRGV